MIKTIIFDWNGTLYKKDNGLFPFTKEVLKKLKPRYKLGIVTLAKEGIPKRKSLIKSTGILHYFNSIIYCKRKTKKGYLECMAQLDSNPKITAIVDDYTIRGIKIGNELECKTFWVKKGRFENYLPNKETGEPDYKIDSIKELLNILKIK